MSESVQSALVGAVALIIGGILTWLNAQGKTKSEGTLSQAQIQANQRQTDIDLIITTMKEQMVTLIGRVTAAEEKADKANDRAAKAEARADEAESRADTAERQLREQERTIAALQQRVAELEGQQKEGR